MDEGKCFLLERWGVVLDTTAIKGNAHSGTVLCLEGRPTVVPMVPSGSGCGRDSKHVEIRAETGSVSSEAVCIRELPFLW